MSYLPNENFICPTERDLELHTENTMCVTRICWVMARWLLGVFFLLFILLHPCFFPPILSMQCRSQGLPTALICFGIAHNGFGKLGMQTLLERGGDERACMCGSKWEVASVGHSVGDLWSKWKREIDMAAKCESIKKKFTPQGKSVAQKEG